MSDAEAETERNLEILDMPPLIPLSTIKFVKSATAHHESKQITLDLMQPTTTKDDDEETPIIINEPVLVNISEASLKAHTQSLIFRLLSSSFSVSILERCLPSGLFVFNLRF